MVFSRPVSSDVDGCQLRSFLARLMSGWRCRGSSAGSGRYSIGDWEDVMAQVFSARSFTVISDGLPRLTGPICWLWSIIRIRPSIKSST